DMDSLFDEPRDLPVASRKAPPIPGLHLPSIRLPPELADNVLQQCMDSYFRDKDVNQVMLFGRTTSETTGSMGSGLPPFLISLLYALRDLLHPVVPHDLHTLLFPPPDVPSRARQAIINLYNSGEGITPHVDLLRRFDDGIMGVSLGRKGSPDHYGLFLPQDSLVILSGDARYKWTHGIKRDLEDLVESEDGQEAPEWVKRGTRLSITFRWLLPGADIVGG
ncbi:hypothetical protein CONPUDRAFT_21331, partial [Coniophora puteana RWD-64-598 SS2]